MGWIGRVDGRKAGEGRRGRRRIAREISESEYIWEDRREREDEGRRRKSGAE